MLVYNLCAVLQRGPVCTGVWDIKAERTCCLSPVVLFTPNYKEITRAVCLVSGGRIRFCLGVVVYLMRGGIIFCFDVLARKTLFLGKLTILRFKSYNYQSHWGNNLWILPGLPKKAWCRERLREEGDFQI